MLAQQLDAAFRQGQHFGLQLILSNEESLRSERILAYFSYLNEARAKTINDLRQTRTDLAAQSANSSRNNSSNSRCCSSNNSNSKRCKAPAPRVRKP
ncbi:hypothetical protein SODG_001748 [Sodalis praecaptivus]